MRISGRTARCATATLAVVTLLASGPDPAAAAAFVVPEWACPGNPSPASAQPAATADLTLLQVPDSPVSFTRAQIADLFAAPDWHPSSHPAMPPIVARGRKPAVYACAYCHLPDGSGRPENAPLAGLPASYIERQVVAFRDGTRRSACSGEYLPAALMQTAAEHTSDVEAREAAAYFSKLPLSRRVDVVETERVPTFRADRWLYVLAGDGSTEPLGQRLVEVALDHQRHELRDSAAGYRAYVPTGSVASGRELVIRGGDGLTLPCAGCHGTDLRGSSEVPPLAGRSPTYLLRQLIAFRTGARSTAADASMTPVVARLEIEHMIAIAAYLAAQAP